MKKVFYISAILLGLGFVSCQKEDVAPTAQDMEAPVWQDAARESSGNAGTPVDTGAGDDGSIVNDVDITDPNADPDAG